MFSRFMLTMASLAVLATAAFAQRGAVVRVDVKTDEIVIRIGEAEHTLVAAKIRLLDKDGKAAKLADFAPTDQVKVTMSGEKVTEVQRVGGEAFAALLPTEGSVVRIDIGRNQLVINVAGAEHTVNAKDVKLLNKDGKVAKLADFAAGDKVKVTMNGETITEIQKTGGEAFVAFAALLPTEGSVVRVDTEHNQLVINVAGAEHTVNAKDVKLLNKDGKVAKLADFAAGDKVKVTMNGETITEIQKAG